MTDGVLLVNKPQGWTSYDVVNFIKKRFKIIKKVGHAGTLDPQATGLLVVLIGRATKLSGKFTGQEKEYEGYMSLGKTTTTGDSDGKIVDVKDTSGISPDDVRRVASEFVGEIEQIPPMVSAARYKGERLYKIARRGVTVPRDPRKVTIYKLEVLSIDMPLVRLRVICSKGTYIRTLCEDIGARLGAGGHSSSLTRTRVGEFLLTDALNLDEISRMDFKQLMTHMRRPL